MKHETLAIHLTQWPKLMLRVLILYKAHQSVLEALNRSPAFLIGPAAPSSLKAVTKQSSGQDQRAAGNKLRLWSVKDITRYFWREEAKCDSIHYTCTSHLCGKSLVRQKGDRGKNTYSCIVIIWRGVNVCIYTSPLLLTLSSLYTLLPILFNLRESRGKRTK